MDDNIEKKLKDSLKKLPLSFKNTIIKKDNETHNQSNNLSVGYTTKHQKTYKPLTRL